METLSEIYKTNKDRTVLNNEYYFRYIFKKTEKIILAVQYVLHKETIFSASEAEIKDIKVHLYQTHKEILELLTEPVSRFEYVAERQCYLLTALLSRLALALAAGQLSSEQYQVFSREIDQVLRSVKQFVITARKSEEVLQDDADSVLHDGGFNSQSVSKRTPPPKERGVARVEYQQNENRVVASTSREEQVLEVLRTSGGASIKDISAVVKDCSEKTIQRQLNKLIKDGTVERSGERRWSRYSVI